MLPTSVVLAAHTVWHILDWPYHDWSVSQNWSCWYPEYHYSTMSWSVLQATSWSRGSQSTSSCCAATQRDLPRTNMATTPDRPHNTWITQLEQDTGFPADQLWTLAADRSEWAALGPLAGSRVQWRWWPRLQLLLLLWLDYAAAGLMLYCG